MIARIPYLLFIAFAFYSCSNQPGDYLCPPCDLKCDNRTFAKPGSCPHCNMNLIHKSEHEDNLVLNEITIDEGSGAFLMEGGSQKDNYVQVFYYLPQNFTSSSKVIFVLPGAGRNGNEYRDAWIAAAEKYSLLVCALRYPEKNYTEFWSYNLGGMITDVNIENETFQIVKDPSQWIYGDFDRIFLAIKESFDLQSDQYDLFGHSAGAQVLHRLAIFTSDSKADRIVASNAGWYTIPTFTEPFPYGLGSIIDSNSALDFNSNLILLLGEDDDENETRGDLRRSPKVDKQGLHRLERGHYFYNESRKIAQETNDKFNWKLQVISNVGHDYKLMSQYAAEYLYGK